MADDDDLDDIGIGRSDEVARKRQAKSRANGWPRELPAHDADSHQLRDYLNAAAQLPAGYAIAAAERLGQYGSDPMTVTITTPGRSRDLTVRFRNQRDASKPAALRAALGEATRGLSRMKAPTTGQAMDFYTALLQLANVAEDSVAADETVDWFAGYVEAGDVVRGSLRSADRRYDTLAVVRGRPQFDRKAAQRYVRDDLEPGRRWTVLVDDAREEQWVRVGEFTTYVRHVLGIGRLAQHSLDALVREAGGDRATWEENRRGRGFQHLHFDLYLVPSVPAIPTVYARKEGE